MSRIARIPVSIPAGVTVTVNNGSMTVNGPKGTLTGLVPEKVDVSVKDGNAFITSSAVEVSNLLGMTRTNLANMVKGVVEGWSRTLELNGTGYRASTSGTSLQLALGFSHGVTIPAPSGISFEVKENKITVKGADKVLVGELAAKIRKLRPADPYKAKGFKYEGEYIARKAGKAAKAGGTAGK